MSARRAPGAHRALCARCPGRKAAPREVQIDEDASIEDCVAIMRGATDGEDAPELLRGHSRSSLATS